MTAPKLPDGLEPVAWGTTRTKDGKQILSEMCVATNPAYVKVHNQHLWDPLVRLSDAQAALQALAAEKDALLAEASKLLKRTPPAAMGMYVGRDRKSFGAQAKELAAAIDSALLAAKEAK